MNKVHKPDDPEATYYREWRRKHKDRINARHRERFETEPEYRQGLRDYHKAWRQRKGKRYVRNINLKNAHGITIDDYDRMLTEQNNGCAICGGQNIRHGKVIPFYVDHCHKTARIRGLLCKECNTALGMLKDNALICEAAARYLYRHS